MRRFALALLAAGCVAFAGAKALLADDPAPKAPLSDEEQARVKQLIDNLGSDDFRIREAATKELTEMGPRARTPLEAATKSSVPEVRFRADQILRKLDGQRRERRLTDGDPAAPRPPVAPAPGGAGGFSNDGYEQLMKQFEEQMAKLREQTDKSFGQGGFGLTPGLFGPMDLRVLRGGGGGRFHAETADLQVSPRSTRLTLAEKAPDGSPVTVTYEAKSVDLILSAHPELRDRPGVASVVDQAKKAADEAAAARGSLGGITVLPRGSFSMSMNGVDVRIADGKTTVKITEIGPDGKPVDKTYEGKDLDQIKREHPEIADRLGGFNFKFSAPVIVPGMPGRVDDDGEEDDGDEATATQPQAGPFGLALRALDAAQRAKTGLAEGAGLVVVMVRKGSDADAAGLQAGDVVTAVDGAAVRAQAGIKDQVQVGRAKGRIVFEVLRDGKALTLTWKK